MIVSRYRYQVVKTHLVEFDEELFYQKLTEILEKYEKIHVNGSVRCAESISGYLTKLSASNSVSIYPDDCMILNDTFIVDKYFPLRAKEDNKYYVKDKVIIQDKSVDMQKLVEKNVRFVTEQLIIPEEMVESCIELFDEKVNFVVIPAGMALHYGDAVLNEELLKKEGYTLLTCDSGTKALRIANEKHPNLILLDIMMPEMDGYEVLQHLKSNPETTDIPVIIMSALSDMQSIVKGYQLGATEYVTKPFQREELVKRVAHRYELYSIKRIKAELENTIESRDTLYSVIAHDLRSPLGSLKMMNNAILMMVDKERVGDEVYEMIQMMNKTSEEIFLLLDNLLKWAKNRLNKQHVYKQQTDINSIIDSTAEMYIPMAAQKGVKIILENLDKELVGLVDIDMLKTIIRNLISNAMKFSFEGARSPYPHAPRGIS